MTPGRIIPDSAIVAAAQAMPTDRAALLGTKGFHGRGAERYAKRWVAALQAVRDLPESDLPTRAPRGDGPPVARAWAEKDPVAARRLTVAREAGGPSWPRSTTCRSRTSSPPTPCAGPCGRRPGPATRRPLTEAVRTLLAGYGARPWQIDLTTPILVSAILEADKEPPPPDPEDVVE